MPRHWLFLLLSAFSVFASTGCCVNRAYGPVDPCVKGCGGGDCHDGTCHGGGHAKCDSCGGAKPRIGSWINSKLSCGSACGEVYWDEWISDPPDCCDPCDDCGNFVGPQACPPKFRAGRWLDVLWGCRGEECSCGECCPEPVCPTCDGHGCRQCAHEEEVEFSPEEADPPEEVMPPRVPPTRAVPDPKATRMRTTWR